MLGHNGRVKIIGLILEILVWGLLIAILVLFVIFGEVPVSHNGEPPERGGLVP